MGQTSGGVGEWLVDPVGSVFVDLVGTSSIEPALVAILTLGFVGMSIRSMFDSILSDEGGDSSAEQSEGGGLMPEEGGDDLGELGGMGGGDDEEEFGEFEDDEFGSMDSGADPDELDHRLDELETEVGSLSSTVNTVRNENEQISETVDDVEENVRKLLDIYEMVTRGVNPFADDIDAGGMGGQSFGLFDDEDSGQADENLDGDIADADAEGFFDEDLVEDEEELEADTDVGDVLENEGGGEEDPFEDEFEDDAMEEEDDFSMDEGGDDFGMDEGGDDLEMDDSDGGDSEGGKSFADLKDEYESGDADWADEEAESEASQESETSAEPEPETAAVEESTDSSEDSLADDDLFDEVIEDEDVEADSSLEETSPEPEETEVEETTPEPEETDVEESQPEETDIDETSPEPDDESQSVSESATATEEVTDTQRTEESMDNTQTPAEGTTENDADDDTKPYLHSLPDGFLADLIVTEWLEFLVEEVGVRATAEAIDYYERIDWIDESVADQLQAYLKGFEADGDRNSLTIDHHTKSLRYVSQLNGDGAESIALQQMPRQEGGGSDGIQR